jgi:hypothetical protein
MKLTEASWVDHLPVDELVDVGEILGVSSLDLRQRLGQGS